MKAVPAADQPRTLWRNGGGLTRELYRDAEGEAWRLRISLAEVAADGPFSAYPGVQRQLALVAGQGLLLRWPQREQRLSPGDPPLAFAGEHAPEAELQDGPVQLLNLMSRGRRARLLPGPPPPATWCAVFCATTATLFVDWQPGDALPAGKLMTITAD